MNSTDLAITAKSKQYHYGKVSGTSAGKPGGGSRGVTEGARRGVTVNSVILIPIPTSLTNLVMEGDEQLLHFNHIATYPHDPR